MPVMIALNAKVGLCVNMIRGGLSAENLPPHPLKESVSLHNNQARLPSGAVDSMLCLQSLQSLASLFSD